MLGRICWHHNWKKHTHASYPQKYFLNFHYNVKGHRIQKQIRNIGYSYRFLASCKKKMKKTAHLCYVSQNAIGAERFSHQQRVQRLKKTATFFICLDFLNKKWLVVLDGISQFVCAITIHVITKKGLVMQNDMEADMVTAGQQQRLPPALKREKWLGKQATWIFLVISWYTWKISF